MVRIPKLNISFEVEFLNEAGQAYDSRTGTVTLHEAGFNITVCDLVERLKHELLRSMNTREEGKDKEDGD